eukprot:SAG22_NODE_2758_length_2239_cov_1.881776_4_plen_44_part_00
MFVVDGRDIKLYVNGDATEHGCSFTLPVGSAVDTTEGLFLGDS